MINKAGVIIRRQHKNQDYYLIEFPFPNDYERIDLPKGHVEDGETPVQAASRELKEETGIEIPPDQLVLIRNTTVQEGDETYNFYWYEPACRYVECMCDIGQMKKKGSPEDIYGYEWRYSLKGLEKVVLRSLQKGYEKKETITDLETLHEEEKREEQEMKEAAPEIEVIMEE